MSLLWPEKITLGIFPGACWLRGQGTTVMGPPAADSGEALLAALDLMLAQWRGQRRTRIVVDAVVSDAIGVTTVLPWQADLKLASQWEAYARVLFEAQGRPVETGWVVQPGYRRYGAPGFAVAMPGAWLASLAECVAGHGGRLRSALPVSALAYWSDSSQGSQASVLLLHEDKRLTALVYFGKRFQTMDVQPVMDDLDGAVQRICRRLEAAHGTINQIRLWSSDDGDAALRPVALHMPATEVLRIPRSRWSRR